MGGVFWLALVLPGLALEDVDVFMYSLFLSL